MEEGKGLVPELRLVLNCKSSMAINLTAPKGVVAVKCDFPIFKANNSMDGVKVSKEHVNTC